MRSEGRQQRETEGQPDEVNGLTGFGPWESRLYLAWDWVLKYFCCTLCGLGPTVSTASILGRSFFRERRFPRAFVFAFSAQKNIDFENDHLHRDLSFDLYEH